MITIRFIDFCIYFVLYEVMILWSLDNKLPTLPTYACHGPSRYYLTLLGTQ